MSQGNMTYIKDIHEFDGQEVMLRGWLAGHRSGGKVQFLSFRDGTGFIQVVASKSELPESLWLNIKELTLESSLRLSGRCRKDARAPSGYELVVGERRLRASISRPNSRGISHLSQGARHGFPPGSPSPLAPREASTGYFEDPTPGHQRQSSVLRRA